MPLGSGLWTDGHERLLSSASVACDGNMHTPSTKPIHQPSSDYYTTHAMPPPDPIIRPDCMLYSDLDSNPGKVGFGRGTHFWPDTHLCIDAVPTQYRLSASTCHQPLDTLSLSHPLNRTFPLLPFSKPEAETERSNPDNPVILGLLSQIYGGIPGLVASSWPAKWSPLRLHTTSGYPNALHHPTIGEPFRKKIKSEQTDLTD